MTATGLGPELIGLSDAEAASRLAAAYLQQHPTFLHYALSAA
jgi:hypothetical protein